MMRICDGLYSEEYETTMRLLLLTRPAMEEFADAVNKLMPGMLVARFKIVVKRYSNSLILCRSENVDDVTTLFHFTRAPTPLPHAVLTIPIHSAVYVSQYMFELPRPLAPSAKPCTASCPSEHGLLMV